MNGWRSQCLLRSDCGPRSRGWWGWTGRWTARNSRGDWNSSVKSDETFMRAAIAEAGLALDEDEVPIGAVVVHEERIIGRGHNQRETLNDPTAHAEMIAITAAASHLQSWRLDECTLFVTLEPCAMCAGAIVLARLPRLVFGARDPKAGACVSL